MDVEEAEVKISYCFGGAMSKAIGAEALEYTAPWSPSLDLRPASNPVGND